jgi:subtilisin-like proprotein convertase family protein
MIPVTTLQLKKTKLGFLAVVVLAASLTHGQTMTYGFTNTVNSVVPDANPSGMTASTNLTGLSGYVSSVTVALDITGGFNGDLYAYLVDPNGDISILLNRTGVGSGNAFGYSDAGFNVVLSDGSSNIHSYQSASPTIIGGQLTGTWAPDGRAIDPRSTPTVFDATTPTADLSAFNSTVQNGQWTLFIADLSAGGQSTLVSWGLTVVTVPEPQTWAMILGGLGGLLLLNRRRR